MKHPSFARLGGAVAALLILLTASTAVAQTRQGDYRGTLRVVKFDVSPALRDIPPIPITRVPDEWGGLMVDPSGTDGPPKYGRQTPDGAVQPEGLVQPIPDPTVVFPSLPNISGVAPPDPVGDIGPNHYVAMSNLSFEVYDRTGMSVFGPAANNTLWAGFGGACETENAGDPIILYDQVADRWLFTQFTSSGSPDYYNCVALSQSPDPTGPWYRWAVANNGLFPDYPKYGIGEEAYYISTRDFNGGYEGVGAYAMNRAELIAGNPSPTIIAFFVDRSTDPETVGDGLLPMDVDGFEWPADSAKHYYLGTQDDGGPYGADSDAINVWEFIVDFTTPANSSFTLIDTLTMSPYDTIYPCTGPQGRNCVPQPDTANEVDHQGYRQRPLHRAAYRKFDTHESIVTLQSVEAAPEMSGMRWWELRAGGMEGPGLWSIFQEGTFAPGTEDGIHRWFGSVAMDSAGNIALGYSASDGDSTYPSIFYSGRLSTDAAGTIPRGEGVIVDGTGSQTGPQRWGDYSSMNIDPTDDCTFWYVNEWVPTTTSSGWQLQVGAFRFDECGDPGFTLSVSTATEASICQGDEAMYGLNVGSIAEFDMPVTLSSMGEPGGTSATFDPNPVLSLPGASTLTIGNTGAVAAGEYDIEITGMATGADSRTADVGLTVFDAVPPTPTLTIPADMATDVILQPTFEWTDTGAESYFIEIGTDPDINDPIISETVNDNQFTPFTPLASGTTYYWSVAPSNACGFGKGAAVSSFTTLSLPGDCAVGEVEVVAHSFDFEDGAQGWTFTSALGSGEWNLSTDNPNSGAQHWHGDDVAPASDHRLSSPALAIPTSLSNLTFRFFNYQDLESNPPSECWDGGILEVSIDGGPFTQVLGGDLLTDPYDGTITNGPNPLSGQPAWCGQVQPYTDTRADISSLAGEDNVVFRFRIGTDDFVGTPGWDIDDVKVVGCSSVLEYSSGFEQGEGQ